jgi:hypothetical protein
MYAFSAGSAMLQQDKTRRFAYTEKKVIPEQIFS